jgi:hypothetical protein
MKPDRCSFCKGKLYEGKTEFVAKVGGEVSQSKTCQLTFVRIAVRRISLLIVQERLTKL